MKGQENLVPTTERSKEEVREMQRKGGVNSGIARRRKKSIKENLQMLLELTMTDGHGGKVKSPLTGKDMSVAEAIATATIKEAVKGNVKAAKLVADVLGENVININSKIEQRTPEEARRMLFGDAMEVSDDK